MRRWVVLALGMASLTACLVSIDESRLDALAGDDDDDDDNGTSSGSSRRDGGRTTDDDPPVDAGSLPDVLVEAPEVEAGVVLPSSCKDALAKNPGATTGPTSIDFQGQQLTLYCDQATRSGGWTMLHRLSAGPGLTGDPVVFYNSIGLNDTVTTEVTPKKTATHYTSRLLNRWNVDFPVAEAMVRVFDANGNPAKEVVFNAGTVATPNLPRSTSTSFFRPERILASSWTDLNPGVSFSDFGIDGSNDIGRRFNIVARYATCDTDKGWLLAHSSTASGPCTTNAPPVNTDYELPNDRIRIYYAPGTTLRVWKDGVADASSMAVFVR